MRLDRKEETTPIFLDFEASSLSSSSYPIEVAWNRIDGSVESHLISPAGIENWTDWSAKAEALHGLDREMLKRDGKKPSWICERMNEELAGKIVYVEDLTFDGMWLSALFSVCWKRPTFELKSIDEILESKRNLAALKDHARRLSPARHRAKADVEYLITLWKLMIKRGRESF
jgi:DNA polymerase III epsilon subunit-like protein